MKASQKNHEGISSTALRLFSPVYFLIACSLLAAVICSGFDSVRTVSAATAAGELDTAYAPAIGINSSGVIAYALQPDGKIIVGGNYNVLGGVIRNYLARINANGTVDNSFQPSINNAVTEVFIKPDGKVLIGGFFTMVNGVSRSRLACLNADGSLDASFNSSPGANGDIWAVAFQADGKILIGGNFTQVDTVNRSGIARLNADGSIDPFFEPGLGVQSSPNSPTVYTLLVQADGKIVLGGDFTGVNNISRNDLARLNADGSVDTGFAPLPGSNGIVYALAQQSDAKILVGGTFTTFNGAGRIGLARLETNGLLDNTFVQAIGGDIRQVVVQVDGRILVTGNITDGIARLNANGTLDAGFNPGPHSLPKVIAVLADGKIMLGSQPSSAEQGSRVRLERLNADGSTDTAFELLEGASINQQVNAILPLPNGKALIGGVFNMVNQSVRNGIAKLNSDGTVDTSFNGAAINVWTIVRQPDGKILVGGFNVGVSRLNPDGSPDPAFTVGTLNTNGSGLEKVETIALQADGKILVGGSFGGYNGVTRGGIARLNSDGTVDMSFTLTAGNFGRVHKIIVQPDGKILVAAEINSFQPGNFRGGLERFNPNNTLDTSFNIAISTMTGVTAMALRPDGKIYFGTLNGAVGSLNPNGTADASFASVNNAVYTMEFQPNGKLVIGGTFTGPRTRVARYLTNGQLEPGFAPVVDDPSEVGPFVRAVAIQADGKILIGGAFRKVNNVARTGLARLAGDPVAGLRAPFDFDGDGKTDIAVFRPSNGYWYITRSSNQAFMAQQFGVGSDKLVPGDYDGDGSTNFAIWRPSTGTWYTSLDPATNFGAVQFGVSSDIPVPGDYDGDGKTDVAVYRPSASTFYLLYSSNGSFHFQFWGQAGDIPVTGDYDGDGKTDFAILRPSSNTFYILQSFDGAVRGQQWGASGDKIVAGDYDGDGKTDIAVFRPSNGGWYILRSSDNGFTGIAWGTNGDVPAAGDYDGDGKWDEAVFRPSNGTFYILQSSDNSLQAAQFGTSGDIPVPSAFVP